MEDGCSFATNEKLFIASTDNVLSEWAMHVHENYFNISITFSLLVFEIVKKTFKY